MPCPTVLISINTANPSAAALKRLLTGCDHRAIDDLRLFVISFAYRRGIDRDGDPMFDVRFSGGRERLHRTRHREISGSGRSNRGNQ